MNSCVRCALLALLALTGACSTPHPHTFVGIHKDLTSVRQGLLVPGTLPSLPTLAVSIETVSQWSPPAPEGEGEELPFDPSILVGELLETLEASGVVERIVRIQDLDGRSVEVVAPLVRPLGAALFLKIQIGPTRLVRTDRDMLLPTVAWVLGGFPSFWFHNHTYQLQAPVRVELYDLHTVEPLFRQAVSWTEGEQALNFFERTSDPLVYLLSNVYPSVLCPVDEERVARNIAPWCARAICLRFLQHPRVRAIPDLPTTIQADVEPGACEIQVTWPPLGEALRYPSDRVRLTFEVLAPERGTIAEVRYQDELVFPARAAAEGTPPPVRARLRCEVVQSVTVGEPVVITATDVSGEVTTVRLTATPAGRPPD